MHIDLTFWEAVQFAALIMGGMFALLKFASYQFMRNITLQLKATEESVDRKVAEVALTMVDRLRLQRIEMELEQERRHSAYLEKFATKPEMDAIIAKHDKTVDNIFEAIRRIEEKFSNTVSKDECISSRGKQ